MPINVIEIVDANRFADVDEEICVINVKYSSTDMLTLKTRVVEPFSLYMSKKIISCYICKFLYFYECFSPLYIGVLTVDVVGLEATPCL